MKLLSRRKDPAPKLVPGNATAALFDTLKMEEVIGPNSVGIGVDGPPEWITEEEASIRSAAEPTPPSFEELMLDSDVRTVVEAFIGEKVVLDLLAA